MTIGEMLDMSKAEGRAEGRIEMLLGVLADLGQIPEELQKAIMQLDADALKAWTKAAARAESMEEFLDQIQK
jgi:hypothetical protein